MGRPGWDPTFLELLSGRKWVVRRTIWPFKDGWGTYNPSTRTVLDSGLSHAEAQQRCDELNTPEKDTA